jgi:signal transduction histidine kinase
MQLDVAVDQLPETSPTKPRLERILNLMRQVDEEGRNALRGLRLTSNGSQDIAVALSTISQELKGGPEDTTFRVIVEGSARPLHPIVRDEVYRIGREAVVNAFRHSRAKHITVEVSYLENQLRLLITDDGCGINPEVLQSGRDGHWGLSGMRERAERIKASLKLRSRIGSGTEVELSVPTRVAFEAQSSNGPLRWLNKLLGRKATASASEMSKETKQ